MEKRGYKDLHVWRESVLFVSEVYALTRGFPVHERFALCSQMQRAAISIPANIAEGQAGHYRKGFLKHLYIAKGSLAELHTLMVVAEQIGYLSPNQLEQIEERLFAIAKPLHGLIGVLRHELRKGGGDYESDAGGA